MLPLGREQHILIIDDTPFALSDLIEALRDEYSISVAVNWQDTLKCLSQDKLPDLILLDIMMPEIDGYEVLQRLKDDRTTRWIPVIFITAINQENDEAKGFELGVVDFITKPFDLSTVRARIKTHVKLKLYQERLEEMVTERTFELTRTNERLKQTIDDYHQAEKAVRKSEARYQDLYDNAPDMYLSVDAGNGKIIRCNQRTFSILGYDNETLIGRPIVDLQMSEKGKAVMKGLFSIFSGEEAANGIEFQVQCRDGTPIDVSMNARAVYDGNGDISYILLSWRDISEKKRLESRLQTTQRLESIGALAGGIAHDFNNILSIIFGFTEIAINNAQGNIKLQGDLREILIAGMRARELVRQILTFSQHTESDYKQVSLKEVVEEVVCFVRASLPSTIEFNLEIDTCSDVFGDATQIHQVIMNLCTNAVHAMREHGGILTVALEDVEFDADLARFHGVRPGPHVSLAVNDQGKGMHQEVTEKIFDPFFTTKEKTEGTGLGLSIVHGIVKNHQGAIHVSSSIGKGSSFTVFLPAVEKQAFSKTVALPQVETGDEHILVVDDEAGLSKINQRMLESLGYRVTTRTRAIEALELFKTDPFRFDLVVTDMIMPEMNGEKLARKLLAVRADLPIIICTGFSAEMDGDLARAIGVKAFLYKPILKQAFAETIRRVLDE